MSSGFISEAEAAEVRKKRQEEWEKVRKPTDPVERPEEPYDNRSLFDRLLEQKQKKELEYEEAHKLKNMIRGLDDDETEYLDLVDRTKIAANRKNELEESRELNEYRNRVLTLQEKTIKEKLEMEITAKKTKKPVDTKFNQQKLLKGIVVKKPEPVKRKMSTNTEENQKHDGDKSNEDSVSPKQQKITNMVGATETICSEERNIVAEGDQLENSSAMKCVAVLPGLGYYESSSDENSSDSDTEFEKTPEKDCKNNKAGVKMSKLLN